ncbi:hypothetical protein M2322_004180 [Rhodoblastus acidophilus]|uniref:multiubiquitin domain-containing protein n=1 Tax=Rhodoblastus acidophilus TaxID=1074 RepID=UPI002225AAD3|nr:multiubiquitin domain-containing protein [Rhodoblastus acidophilus]MCW2318611.1 hypothetical protein [Rhodoblastus acidophilus]
MNGPDAPNQTRIHIEGESCAAPEVSAHMVRIHINREPYESPNPSTGEALYVLGDIPEHQKLYRETGGDEEDTSMSRDDDVVPLVGGEHFYSQDVMRVLVNGDEHEIQEEHISYAQVVDLFLGGGGKASNEYLVKYSHGPIENQSGVLAPGQKVKVKYGMRFRVAGTGES